MARYGHASGPMYMLRGFKDLAVWVWKDSHHAPVTIVWILFALYYLVNARAHFGENFAPTIERSAIIYLVMVTVFYTFAMRGQKNSLDDTTIGKFALQYALIFLFVGGLIALAFNQSGFRPPEVPVGATSNSVLFFIIFLIAFPEELFFRDWLPRVLMRLNLNHPWSAQMLSAVAFGFWHFAAYNRNPAALVFAIGAGLVFGFVRENGFAMNGTRLGTAGGLVSAIALHSVYNAAVFGVFCMTCDGLANIDGYFAFIAPVLSPVLHLATTTLGVFL